MNSMILFFSMPNIHAFPHMQILNMMHFSYIITYSRVTTQLFLGNIVSRIIFQNLFNPKQHLCNMIIFENPIKKLLTSTVQSKFTSTGHHIQPIKLLVPSPSTLEPRSTSIKPINNKVYYKIMLSNLSP